MTNIVNIKGKAADPNVVLNEANDAYESVVVIGWDKDGYLDARASINLEGKDILWIIEVFKKKLINGDYLD